MGRFQYTGQVWLEQLGLYHYKARTYSPTLGRFLQTDPIRYGDGLNMYAYVGNDPVNRIDPSGLIGYCLLSGVWHETREGFTDKAAKDYCKENGGFWQWTHPSLENLPGNGGEPETGSGNNGEEGGGAGPNRIVITAKRPEKKESTFWDCAADIGWGVAEQSLIGGAITGAAAAYDTRNERFSGGNMDGRRFYPNNSRAAGFERWARYGARRITQATVFGSVVLGTIDAYNAYQQSESCGG